MAALCRCLKRHELELTVFSSQRHLDDVVDHDRRTLRSILDELAIPYSSTDDINSEPGLREYVTPTTLGLALGAAWVFEKQTVELFQGKLLDFMGIALPEYRGGAHYSWQILRRNKLGCCNLQIIEGGHEAFHKGEIIKRQEYVFPSTVRIPQDYFDAAVPHEVAFLEEFFAEVAGQRDFERHSLQEDHSTYFPFLSTLNNGFINWSWRTEDIESFICAFDDPYAGASTFLNGERVFLKNCYAELGDGDFHPFQSGLVYRKTDKAIFVATAGGAIVVRSLSNETGGNMFAAIQPGVRFYTPQTILDQALQFNAVYDAGGLRSSD